MDKHYKVTYIVKYKDGSLKTYTNYTDNSCIDWVMERYVNHYCKNGGEMVEFSVKEIDKK